LKEKKRRKEEKQVATGTSQSKCEDRKKDKMKTNV
jgi:hypothetical protein